MMPLGPRQSERRENPRRRPKKRTVSIQLHLLRYWFHHQGEEPLGGEGGGDCFFVVFGNLLGFLFGWSTVLLIHLASNAVQFLTFVEYFSQVLLIVSGAGGGASHGLVTVLALTSGSKCVCVWLNLFLIRI